MYQIRASRSNPEIYGVEGTVKKKVDLQFVRSLIAFEILQTVCKYSARQMFWPVNMSSPLPHHPKKFNFFSSMFFVLF